MGCDGGVGIGFQLGPQGSMLPWRNGATTSWRCLCSKRIFTIPSFPCQQPLDSGEADPEGGCNFGAWHASGCSDDDTLAEIKGVGFHALKYAKYSVFLLTAVEIRICLNVRRRMHARKFQRHSVTPPRE